MEFILNKLVLELMNIVGITLDQIILSIVLMLDVSDLLILSIINTRQKVDLFLVGSNICLIRVNIALKGRSSGIKLRVERRGVDLLSKLGVYEQSIVGIGRLIQLRVIQSREVIINFGHVGNTGSMACSKCCSRESTNDRNCKNRFDHCLLHSRKFLDIKG